MKSSLIVIQNDMDHKEAKALLDKLMGSDDPAKRARMVAQARLIEAYERTRWPRRAPRLPDLLTYLMDQHALSRADLVPLFGTASRVSEVLSGKRALSITMVRWLRERFHISADLLIPPKPAGHSLSEKRGVHVGGFQIGGSQPLCGDAVIRRRQRIPRGGICG